MQRLYTADWTPLTKPATNPKAEASPCINKAIMHTVKVLEMKYSNMRMRY